MFKKLNKKGFTLAELLVVVAIIGVLVAISIPIFTSQLEKAREATDEANLRSFYAECSAAALTGVADNTDVTVTKNNTTGVITATSKEYTMKQQKTGLQDGAASIEIGGVTINKDNFKTGKATVTVTSDGEVNFKIGGTDNKGTTAATPGTEG